MKRKRIAIDIDNVLADFTEGFIDFSNNRWGTSLGPKDYHEDFEKLWGVDTEEVGRRFLEINKSGITSELRHIDGASEVLKKLKQKYDLWIITSRRPYIKNETLSWVEDRFPDIFDQEHIYFIGSLDFSDKSNKVQKGEIAKELGMDYIIDDQMMHCVLASSFGIKSLIFGDRSKDDTDRLPKDIYHVSNWQEVQRFFDDEK